MSANSSISSIPPIGPTTGVGVPPPGGGRFKPIDPLGVLRRHLWLLVALVVVGVGGGVATWYVLREVNPWYSSSALVNIAPVNPDAWSGVGEDMHRLRMDAVRAALENEQLRLRSEQTLRAAMERSLVRDTAWFAGFVGRDGQTIDVHAAFQTLQERMLRTRVVPGSTQMEVTVRTPQRDDAEPILRAILDTYVARVRAEREDESRGVRQVYLNERQRAEQQIERLMEQLERFPRDTRMASIESELEDAQNTRRELTHQYLTLQMSLAQAQEHYASLQEQHEAGELAPTARAIQEVEQRSTVQRLDHRLQELRTEKRSLEARFGAGHHRIRDMERRIAAAEEERQAAIDRYLAERKEAELEYAKQTVSVIQGRLARLEPDLEEARLRVQDLTERWSEHQDRYEQLREQLQQARQDRQRYDEHLTSLRVQATRPDAVRAQAGLPSTARLASPKAEIVIPAVALLVVGLGTGGLLLRETLDQRLKTPADVKLIHDADLLGIVPHAQEDPSGDGRVEHAVTQHPAGLLAEAFRQVRTAILGKMERRGYKTLLIAGGRPGSGASTIAHNLACSLAAHGRHVLLIDANLRRPAQHALCDIPQSPGLVELLKGTAKPEWSIVSRDGGSLVVLPAGELTDAPPELLAGAGFRSLLSQLESEYDMVILDAPPALLASDTPLLARHVDAMALIVRAERDQRGMVERMLRQLDGQRADVLGLILNAARSSAGGYFRKSYREFYRYTAYANGRADRNGHTAPKRLPGRATSEDEAKPVEEGKGEGEGKEKQHV